MKNFNVLTNGELTDTVDELDVTDMIAKLCKMNDDGELLTLSFTYQTRNHMGITTTMIGID
jgi:hypothetical protein